MSGCRVQISQLATVTLAGGCTGNAARSLFVWSTPDIMRAVTAESTSFTANAFCSSLKSF